MNDYDSFVDSVASELDAEQGPAMAATPGQSMGSVFRDVMDQVKAKAGAIPWLKLIVVAGVVIQDIKAGKTVAEIVQDVLALLASGQI